MRARAQGLLACFLVLVPYSVACSAPDESPEVECRSSAIVGGTEYAEYVALATAQEDAIVRLTIAAAADTPEALCTAVIVAPRAALTAAHCVSGTGMLSLHVDADGGEAHAVSVAAVHPSLDLAVLTWDFEDAALDAVRPIPVDLE